MLGVIADVLLLGWSIRYTARHMSRYLRALA
jgi:hypothetical protein